MPEMSPFFVSIVYLLYFWQGFDALDLLQSLCCSDINIPVGDVVNTLMLNKSGGCEVQCDIVRLDNDRYMYCLLLAICVLWLYMFCRYLVMSQPEQATTLYHWMRKHNTSVGISDVTGGLSVIRLLGPDVTNLLMDCASLSKASGEMPGKV